MSETNNHTIEIYVHESEHNSVIGRCDSGADVQILSLQGWMVLDTGLHEGFFDDLNGGGPLLVECDECGSFLAVIKFLASGRSSKLPDLIQGQLHALLFPLGNPQYASVEDNLVVISQKLPVAED